MFLIFRMGEEGRDPLSKLVPGRDPKVFFLKGKMTKRKREEVFYFRNYESLPDSSMNSKNSSLNTESSRVLASNSTLKLGN